MIRNKPQQARSIQELLWNTPKGHKSHFYKWELRHNLTHHLCVCCRIPFQTCSGTCFLRCQECGYLHLSSELAMRELPHPRLILSPRTAPLQWLLVASTGRNINTARLASERPWTSHGLFHTWPQLHNSLSSPASPLPSTVWIPGVHSDNYPHTNPHLRICFLGT
jgi:hypothetical protein